MIQTEELFPLSEAGPMIPPPPPTGRAAELAGLSPGARRTRRRLWAIEAGINPLTKLPLHVNAPTDATSKDRYLRDFTCGTCRFKMTVTVGNKTVAKCRKATTWSEYSDLRNWLPACESYVKSA